MGPVGYLIGLLCLFSVVLIKAWRKNRPTFWVALLVGVMGILIGSVAMISGARILGLKVLDANEIDRMTRSSQRRGQWRGGSERAYREGQNYRLAEERLKLAMFVRALDSVTEKDLDFLEKNQAGSILTVLEAIISMPRISDREAAEMLVNIDDRLSPHQQEVIRRVSLPKDSGVWSIDGQLLNNPFQSKVNSAAVLALQKRYDYFPRATVSPDLLGL